MKATFDVHVNLLIFAVRANITKKLQDGEYRLEMDYSKRSKAWKQFGIVTDETGQKMKYVACKVGC